MRNTDNAVVIIFQRLDRGEAGAVARPQQAAGGASRSGSFCSSAHIIVVLRFRADDLILIAQIFAGLGKAELNDPQNRMIDQNCCHGERRLAGVIGVPGRFFCGGLFLGFGVGFGGSSGGIGRGGVGGRGLSLGGTCGQTKDHDDRQEQSDQFFHFA